VELLSKGKATTSQQRHSGEGIFFTSRASDIFVLDSYGKKLTFDNLNRDLYLKDVKSFNGTRVKFSVSERSRKDLKEVFDRYTGSDSGFDTTEFRLKLVKRHGYLSRSEAKRLLAGLEKFKKVLVDFEGVETIGQAFADEV